MQLSRTLFNTADAVYCKLIIYSKPQVRGSFHPQLAFSGRGAGSRLRTASVLDGAKALEHFAGQPAKSVGGARAGRELEDRLRRSRRLFERPAGQNLGVEDVVAILCPQPFADLGRRGPRRIDHRQQDAEEPGAGAEPHTHLLHRRQQGDQCLDGEVLRSDRHDQRIRGDDGVDADERQARRAVENDQLVLMFEPLQ